MNQPNMFTSGLELANLAVSSDLLHLSWAAILELYRDTNPNDQTLPVSIKSKVYPQTPNGTIIAFVPSPPCNSQHLQGEGRDLVSSQTLSLRDNFPLFEFVGTKVNPSFCIHRTAVTIFASLQDQLSSLKDQCLNISPLIITGHSIGGSIASLFTIWLLESISPKASRRPWCITFGSPLIGDNGFQQAILERPMWNSCFLHVASNQDPIPKLFASLINVGSTSHTRTFKPFGTFILCSESGCACFEEPESVLDLMVAISSNSVGNQGPNEGLQIINYGDILEKLKHGAICRGISELGEWDASPLRTGIIIQIEAIKVGRTPRLQENGNINSLITKIEKRAEDLAARKKNVFDPKKKLNETKIHMAYLEWFKKFSESDGGYYNIFKTAQSKPREEIVKRKNILTQYWDKKVKEAGKMPQKEGAFFRIGWLYAGTNYRRMVEPLDIAEWYKKGKKDYVSGRSEHYKLLEQWVKDDKLAGHQSNANERNRACSLTEDSCFWAHVEEAFISCQLLEDRGTSPEDKESSRESLVKFETYVMDSITNYAVSPEIFLNQSRLMQWWANYEKIKGTTYHSPLTIFMRNDRYKQYA